MPLYDYWCESCGAFSEWHSIHNASEPVPCPTCQDLARRVISAPNISTLAKGVRMAWERNERSAHEPQVIRRERAGQADAKTPLHRS